MSRNQVEGAAKGTSGKGQEKTGQATDSAFPKTNEARKQGVGKLQEGREKVEESTQKHPRQ